jgi:hypothetical protein
MQRRLPKIRAPVNSPSSQVLFGFAVRRCPSRTESVLERRDRRGVPNCGARARLALQDNVHARLRAPSRRRLLELAGARASGAARGRHISRGDGADDQDLALPAGPRREKLRTRSQRSSTKTFWISRAATSTWRHANTCLAPTLRETNDFVRRAKSHVVVVGRESAGERGIFRC